MPNQDQFKSGAELDVRPEAEKNKRRDVCTRNQAVKKEQYARFR